MLFLAATALAHWVKATPAQSAAPSADVPFYATTFEQRPDPKTLTALGRALFSDPSLSASGAVSGERCPARAHGYGRANRRAVQRGGPDGKLPGLRPLPSLKSPQTIPPFSERFF